MSQNYFVLKASKLLLSIFCLFLVLNLNDLHASNRTGSYFGVIYSKNQTDNTINLYDQFTLLIDAAQIIKPDGSTGNFDDIEIGQYAILEHTLNSNHQVIFTKLTLKNLNTYPHITLIGNVDTLNVNSITKYFLNKYPIEFTPNCYFEDYTGTLAGIGDLKKDSKIEINAYITEDDTVAYYVIINHQYVLKTEYGFIKEIDTNNLSILMNKKMFTFFKTLNIADAEGVQFNISDLNPGTPVKIINWDYLNKNYSNDIVIDTTIKYDSVSGIIEKIFPDPLLPNEIVVNNKSYRFIDSLEVYKMSGELTTPSFLQINQNVSLHFIIADSNNLIERINIVAPIDSTDLYPAYSLIGKVNSSSSNNSLLINNTKTLFDPNISFMFLNGTPATIADALTYKIVKAEGYIKNNEFYALTVKIDANSNAVADSGYVQTNSDSVFSINSKIYNYIDTTLVYNQNNIIMDKALLNNNMYIIIKGFIYDFYPYINEIRVKPITQTEQTFTIKAELKSLTNKSFMLKDTLIYFSPEMKLTFDNGLRASINDIHENDMIKCIGNIMSNGEYIAKSIEITLKYGQTELIQGLISLSTSNTIIVADQLIYVPDTTYMYFENMTPAGKTDLLAGKLVEVKATDVNQRWIASKITIRGFQPEYYKIYGIITYMHDDTISVGKTSMLSDYETSYFLDNAASAEKSTLETGQLIEAYVKYESVNQLPTAKEIEIKNSQYVQCINLIDTVKSCNPTVLTIQNYIVTLADFTNIRNYNGTIATLGEIKQGVKIKLSAVLINNDYVAKEIIIKNPNEMPSSIGYISNIKDSSMYVNNTLFMITYKTIFKMNKGKFIEFSDIKPGMLLEVAYVSIAGIDIAQTVTVQNSEYSAQAELIGSVSSMTNSMLTVNNTKFKTNSNTVYLNKSYDIISRSDIHANMIVNVKSLIYADTLSAVSVQIIADDKASIIKTDFAVETIDTSRIRTADNFYIVNPQTVYYDISGNMISKNKLDYSSHVFAQADIVKGQRIASKIFILDGINSVEEISALKNSILISPNPANSDVSISYDIVSDSYTTIDLYTIEGSKISTIYSGNDFAGTNTVKFNCSDLAGGAYYIVINSNGINSIKMLSILK